VLLKNIFSRKSDAIQTLAIKGLELIYSFRLQSIHRTPMRMKPYMTGFPVPLRPIGYE